MLGFMHYEDLNENLEMKGYYKSEYKNDWEVHYFNFISESKAQSRKDLMNKLNNGMKSFLNFFIPETEAQKLERELSKCKTLSELEIRQRELSSPKSNNIMNGLVSS
jgi:hypothetical protein